MFKNKTKKLIVFLIVIGLFAFFSSVFAQNFGINEVGAGLNNSLAVTDPRVIAGRIINIVLGFLGVMAVGIIMWGGFVWLTSNGEEENIKKAKNILKNGVIGLVIILASWAIAIFVLTQLGGGIGGGGSGRCADGDSRSCGCENSGSMYCSGGNWGLCVGASTDCGSDEKPVNCNARTDAVCQAVNQMCAEGDYCDSTSCKCKIKGQAGDSCDANTGNQTCDADNNLCGEYLSCSLDTCVCFGPPVITEISPIGGFCQDNPNKSCVKDFDCGTTCNLTSPNGAVDNFITVYGKSFGTYSSSTSKVIFEGTGNPVNGKQPIELNPACINSWRDNEIIIAVPSGASTGPIKVVNKDNLSDETNNNYGPKIDDFLINSIVRPGLCSLSPDQGVLSDRVDYQGFNLFSGNAYFGNYQSNVQGIVSNFTNQQGLTGSSYIPNIKSGVSGSFVVSNLNGNKQSSNSLLFIKDQEVGIGPYIISFWPIEGNAGQYVTIRGSGFGSSKGTSKVFFGDVEASYDFPDVCLNSVWKDNQIIVKVPPNLPNASHVIKIKLGTLIIDSSKIAPSSLTSNTFRSDKNLDLLTSICKIEPSNGPVATPVNLYGENFGPQKSEVSVKFTSAVATTSIVQSEGKADLIKTIVPPLSITGPVTVIKKGLSGNEINFTVGSCTVNADCGAAQVCCPAGTYREGRCFGSLESCSSDVPTSVFEWSFSTSFTDNPPNPYFSCSGMAKALNSCQVGATCPNTVGTCSPYAGGNKKIGQTCDFSCIKTLGCSVPGSCLYDSTLNKCVSNNSAGICSMSQKFVVNVDGKDKEFNGACNQDKHWEIVTSATCPSKDWTRISGNRCVNLNSSCLPCDTGLTCESATTGPNRCVSALVCPSESICDKNADSSGEAKCVSKDESSCSCCCTIDPSGKDTQSCCAGLKCAGTCGTDTTDDGKGLGSCTGCASAGATVQERDAACNCTGHSGQFCDISDSHSQGICSDCTSLSDKPNCDDHSAACCFDANKTSVETDDSCRGGLPILDGIDKGYCAYYNCQSTSTNPIADPKLCATSTPVKLGFYPSINACTATSTGCSINPGIDYCSLSDGNFDKCTAQSSCCYDKTSNKCKGGAAISLGTNKGYCAYYDCQLGNNKLCNLSPAVAGRYMSTSTCAIKCANEEGGAGMSCQKSTSTTTPLCDFNSCSLPGLQCLTATGTLGLLPDCGSCCCQPGLTPDSCTTAQTPTLHCQADKGNCSGAGRGLCCGCSADSDCGNENTTGCGADSCCEARPQIETVTPPHLAEKVCRNTVIKIAFNQLMDISSANKVILLEGKKSGLCQAPSTLADASIQELLNNRSESKLAKIYNSINNIWQKLVGLFGGKALADKPDSTMIYCSVPGSVQNLDEGKKTSLVFSPNKLLNPDSLYYIVVLGDENLNSQSGVISLKGIGFNGEGYYNSTTKAYVEGDQLKFNNKVYKNSRISKFTTLGGTDSICKIDHILTTPSSYLFSTTNNDLNEKDDNAKADNFDTVSDKDKVFTAQAYSKNGQALQPVTGYYWDWKWQIENSQIATIGTVTNLETNKAFVSAQTGITDDSTKVKAIVDMRRFQAQSGCTDCECSGVNCSNNCCNYDSSGDLFNGSSDLYVFVCQNPWPPVASNGTWAPWSDNCNGVIVGCSDYNYKFYYCRDAGDSTTLDDLPAIINDAVIKGQSTNTVCSSDHSSCTGFNTPCGQDRDGNGILDGVCLWNVLKESYFFREASTQGGQIISATDMLTGDSVRVTWRSESALVDYYKIYYSKNGQGELKSLEIKPVGACQLVGTIFDCNTIVTGLNINTNYLFKVSAVSKNKVESLLLGEITTLTSDKTPPRVPVGLKGELKNNKVVFTWTANTDKATSYILYHGVYHFIYGESFSSVTGLTSMEFDVNKFDFGNHYFTLSAVDATGNESSKSVEVNFIKSNCATPTKPVCANFSFGTAPLGTLPLGS